MTDVKQQILDKIKAYDSIMLFRHIRLDGDCVGSTIGLKALIKATWPEKQVLLIDDQQSDFLAFMNETAAEVPDEVYASSLGIVIDAATPQRISNPKYALCKELNKIDHHIERDPYADICWVEEERSSACEMIAVFYDTFKSELVMTQQAATSIYAGMVSCMADIKGVDIWVNFTETDKGVLCELRSSRYNINPLAVKYGGGGHMKASGATVADRSVAMQMLADLAAMMGENNA